MSEKPTDVSEKAEAAFQSMVAVVVRRAKDTGTPVVIWEDDQIKEILAAQLARYDRYSGKMPAS